MKLLAVALALSLPPGWHVTHVRTGCTDPVVRVAVARGDQLVVLQERLNPVPAELRQRPAHFRVHGPPTPMACCSIGSRKGWTLQFGDHGRAFYADLYPGREDPQPLLRILDSLRVR